MGSLVSSRLPSDMVSMTPSKVTSNVPSSILSGNPSMIESNKPSIVHSVLPSAELSALPSDKPSSLSLSPSLSPSLIPSQIFTSVPSINPILNPSIKQFKCNKENTQEETIILSRNDKVNLDPRKGYEILQFEGNKKLSKCNKKKAEVIGEETDVKVKNDLYFACYNKKKEECTGKLIVKMKSSSPSLSPIPSSLPIAVTSRSPSDSPTYAP